jgi:hypothetical protein
MKIISSEHIAAWLKLSRPLKVLAFVLVSAATIFARAAYADEARASIALQFGATTLVIPKSALLSVGSRGKDRLAAVESIDVAADESAFMAVPPGVLASFSPPCGEIGQVVLLHATVPPIVRQPLFRSYKPAVMDIEGVSRLVPDHGPQLLDLYQFDANDLRDFWGEKIVFYKSSRTMHVNFQFQRQLRVSVTAFNERCFFERGETLMKRLISFLIDAVKI